MVKSYLASSLEEALELRGKFDLIPYCGGTDLMIDDDEERAYLFLHQVPELKGLNEDDEYIRIGAACTFTELLESRLTPAILKDAVSQIAAPAIRNLGTVGGNIGNGSPKADTALIFFVTDSKVRLMSSKGQRTVPIGRLYLGRNKLDLKPDELITEVLMPKHGLDNYYYKKIGARRALAISRLSFAGLMKAENGRITSFATAFGAITDVILRRDDLDDAFIGKTLDEAKAVKDEYIKAYDKAIVPIQGRISAEYRKDVCMNLLKDFLDSMGI